MYSNLAEHLYIVLNINLLYLFIPKRYLYTSYMFKVYKKVNFYIKILYKFNSVEYATENFAEETRS